MRGLRAPSLAGLVGWLVVLIGFVVGMRPLSDNSLFTHLATGRLIVASGIPREDPYSFTAAGEPWVVQSWLVSLVYGLGERMAGLGAVRALSGLLIGALLGLTWRLTSGADNSLPGRMGLLVLVVGAGAPFWAPRPLLVGLVLLALLLIVTLEGRDPRWAVPIMWAWVNSHGSFPLGAAAVGALCLGRFLDDRAARPAAVGPRQRAAAAEGDGAGAVTAGTGPEVWRPLVWVVIGILAGAIGPMGPRLLVFPVQLLGRMEILSRVVEWRSPSFDQLFSRVFLVQVAVAVLLLVRRPSYRTAVPLVVFTAAALMGQRSIPVASLVLVPGMAAGLDGFGRLRGRERSAAFGVAGGALTVVAVVLAGSVLVRLPPLQLGGYPTDALAWLDQHDGLGTGRRTFAEDTTGNLLELWRGTDAAVFLDDRYDMFPLSVLRDYVALNDASGRWEAILAEHGVVNVVWPRQSPLAALIASSPRWRVRFQDGTHLVACRRGTGPEGDQC
jgi:hypothetical protein